MKKGFRIICITAITCMCIISCQKIIDGSTVIVDPNLPLSPSDLTTKVTVSLISGFVTDGNDAAVKDASVQVGTSTVLTDKYGYFEVRNVRVVQNAAMITIIKPGFFKGVKTYIAAANKAAFFRIKLIPKIVSGTFTGSTGGTVTVTGGLLISFPANGIVNANTNAAYSGTVNVTAYKIDPTSADLSRIMPGDLRGLNSDSQLQLLTSYGMAAVELTGAGGELLQIATGKKATMTMPIPSSIIATAPTTIPLWYFNETNGLWKQEGSANKLGNNYIGDVSHFSFWNYDVPANYVQFNCTVVNGAGQPVQNAYVKISLVSNPNNAGYGYTDSSGYVNGAVPNNSQLKLEVFANASCGNAAAFSQSFSTTNSNVAFGNVTINTITSIAVLTGVINNCAGLPVTNGYVIIREGNLYNRIALSNTGTYSVNKLFCGFPTQITLIGEDVTNLQQNLPVTYLVTSGGINNISTITACGVNTQQFINYTINGITYNYTKPIDTLFVSLSAPNPFNNNLISYQISGGVIPLSQTNYVSFSFDAIPTQGGTGSLSDINSPQIITPASYLNPVVVNFTEYGGPGQFLAGNFTGTRIKTTIPTAVYNFSCSFRVRIY